MEGPDKGILVSGPPVNKDKEEKYCFGSCLLIGFLNPHVWGPDKINSCNSCLLSGPPSIVILLFFISFFGGWAWEYNTIQILSFPGPRQELVILLNLFI